MHKLAVYARLIFPIAQNVLTIVLVQHVFLGSILPWMVLVALSVRLAALGQWLLLVLRSQGCSWGIATLDDGFASVPPMVIEQITRLATRVDSIYLFVRRARVLRTARDALSGISSLQATLAPLAQFILRSTKQALVASVLKVLSCA